MKNKFLNLSAFFAVLLFFSSCEDLLEKVPETQLTSASLSSEENIEAALLGAYDPLQWHVVDGIHVFPIMLDGIRSDDFNAQQQAFWSPGDGFDRFPVSIDNQTVEKLWKKWYAGIGRTNIVIERAEAFDGWSSEEAQNRIVAEGKFLRAFFYFELVRKFGGVPLLTEAVESLNDLPPLERSSAGAIYAQIDQDLNDAIPHLPLRDQIAASEVGRVQQGTAQALLAKSKLYQQDWTACAQLCEAIINSGQYMLEPNFADNFKVATENGPESLLEIQFGDGFTQLGADFQALSQLNNGSGMQQFCFLWTKDHYTSWGNMLPRGELKDLFDDTDVRKEATFLTIGSDMNSPEMTASGFSPIQASSFTGWFPDKSLAPGVTEQDPNDFNMVRKYFLTYEQTAELANYQQSPLNEKIIRYAEVLLMHAEAEARGGATTLSGQQSLDMITTRAGIANIPLNVENVKLERRKELATEGWNRFSDLMRYKALGEGYPARLDLKGFVEGRDELLPIPQAEINTISAEVLSQNPGY